MRGNNSLFNRLNDWLLLYTSVCRRDLNDVKGPLGKFLASKQMETCLPEKAFIARQGIGIERKLHKFTSCIVSSILVSAQINVLATFMTHIVVAEGSPTN